MTTQPIHGTDAATMQKLASEARAKLDAQVYEIVQWHFHESTGCPFWLETKSQLKFDLSKK